MKRPVIALLTDFGLADPFVGVMKAVLVTRCPDATLVDVSHAVPPQAVGEASFWLERSFRWFPAGTLFVAVVDPGVGTERPAVVVQAHGRTFIGPDNGLLFPSVSTDPMARVHRIDLERLGIPEPSRTFHGRDVFAPVAAELAAGRCAPNDVGPPARLTPGGFPTPRRDGGTSRGEVVTIDHFGNLLTNLELDPSLRHPTVTCAALALPLSQTYADVAPGHFVALVNAFGVIEIAERDGNASRSLGLERGATVVVQERRV